VRFADRAATSIAAGCIQRMAKAFLPRSFHASSSGGLSSQYARVRSPARRTKRWLSEDGRRGQSTACDLPRLAPVFWKRRWAQRPRAVIRGGYEVFQFSDGRRAPSSWARRTLILVYSGLARFAMACCANALSRSRRTTCAGSRSSSLAIASISGRTLWLSRTVQTSFICDSILLAVCDGGQP
jgi:hypothetical protein